MPTTPNRLLEFAFVAVQIAVIGWLDYLTSYEVSLAIFYYLPIAHAAWRFGPFWSFLSAFACASVITWAEVAAGLHISQAWISAERFLVRLLGFTFVAFSFNHFRRVRERDSRRIADLERMLTYCACCQKLQTESGDWIEWKTFLHENRALQSQRKVCPTCARENYAKQSLP